MSDKLEAAAIGFLIGAAILSAFTGAGAPFRADEVWTVNTVTAPDMMDRLRADIHPPFYYLILSGWVHLFGASEEAVRALSGVCYLLTALALYLLVRGRWTKHAALAATAFYVCSPLALLSAQLGRMYALAALLAVLSVGLWMRVFLDGDSRGAGTLALANLMGLLTHVWFAFLLLAQGVCILIWCRHRWKPLLLSCVATLASYWWSWGPEFLTQLRKSKEAIAWIPSPGTWDLGLTLGLYGGTLLIALALSPLFGYARRPPLIPVAMLLLALAVPFLISQWKPIYYARFTIVGLPLFAIAAGVSMGRLGTQLALVAPLIAGLTSMAGGKPLADASWTARYLEQEAGAGDLVVFTGLTRLPTDYYLAEDQPAFEETSFPAAIDSHPGYEGRWTPEGATAEAEALADRFLVSGGRRLILLDVDAGPVQALKPVLDRRLGRPQVTSVEPGNQYVRIAVYTVPVEAASR